MTKLKKMGMPTDSVENALAWRQSNIKPTAHGLLPKRETVVPDSPLERPVSMSPSHALELLDIAAAALESGQSIAAIVPTLRAALNSVPLRERKATMLLPFEVMNILVADVLALLPSDRSALCDDGSPAYLDRPMTDSEADEMGSFWYAVAAGEWVVRESEKMTAPKQASQGGA